MWLHVVKVLFKYVAAGPSVFTGWTGVRFCFLFCVIPCASMSICACIPQVVAAVMLNINMRGGGVSVFPLPENSGARWWSPFPRFFASRVVMLRSMGSAWDGTMGVRPKRVEGCFGPGYAGM